MKFKIHWTIGDWIGDWNDEIVVEGDTIEECREQADIETNRRGLDVEKNNLWSEELKELEDGT